MNFKQLATLIVLPSAIFFLSSTTALAGSESGLYIGGSFGNASVSKEGDPNTDPDFKFDESDSGYKLFMGYNFGIIPLIDVAVEGSYVDFGKPSGTTSDGTNIEYDLTAWDAYGLVGLTFGPFALFGKAGLVAWNSDDAYGALSGSETGTDATYGLGVKFQIASFVIRAEYEYFDLDSFDDVYMASIGVAYTF